MSAPDPTRQQDRLRRVRRLSIAAAILAVLALATVIGVIVFSDTDQGASTSPLPTASKPPATSTVPSTGTSSPVSPTTTKPSSAPSDRVFRYLPIWPFGSEQDAAVWQQAYRTEGKQPWHLDAGQTALSFTTGFLGFDEVNTIVSRSVRGDDATVAVGYRTDSATPSVAAVVHLRRIGQGDDAPWEVVGTRDSTFTLDRPRYGAAATSPLVVGGRITGVDESIRVDVRQVSSENPLGTFCCVPAGGERSAWSARVSFRGATDGVLVIVASTGGHYQGVEQFTVTAVRLRD
ncbi:hypothetical protein EV644_1223 [Kribbella orskensis]|uniref:Uncharacterized protein n=1 Tax=Kribbella orskensis TaxID=2512216 RepID=A0ABY2BAW3_9ACTN|nr:MULTISPECIES: hypothetical protein [Kribbella]TCN33382.1 hypothetical protein EV642_1243 [Kribbella sp. VKM Ac-2500]TCO13528.1 hypothetical protein EV644_1223 [Kribbella orskensis]